MKARKTSQISLTLFFIVAIVLLFRGFKTITIIDDGNSRSVDFFGFTVADALNTTNIPIYEGDSITPELNEFINDNQIITISRAIWVTVIDNKDTKSLWTSERLPRKILPMVSMELNPGDVLLSDGLKIELDQPLPIAPVYNLQILRSTNILAEDGQGLITIKSNATTLAEALWESGILIFTPDLITPPLNSHLKGEDLYPTIKKSKEIIIQTKNNTIHTRVQTLLIQDALKLAKIPLQGLDYSVPNPKSPIPANGQVRLVQVREENQIDQNLISYELQFLPLSELGLDSQQVVQVGEFGIKAHLERVIYEDNTETLREFESEWIAKAPLPQIIGYGTQINIRSTNTPDGPIEYWRQVRVYATSYSPCRIGIPGKCSSTTASGAELKKGVIGVIRSWYNYMKGTSVYIPGYGFATIEDIGAGFSDRHWIDLGYSDDEWVNWSGYVTLYFLTPVPANIMYILE